jgi:dihydrofolate reductase
MNEIPKVVFSDSLASADWGETTIAAGDLAEAITRLKQERSDGYLLAHGGARFARSLVETGLIDEYRLRSTRPSWARASGSSSHRSPSSR